MKTRENCSSLAQPSLLHTFDFLRPSFFRGGDRRQAKRRQTQPTKETVNESLWDSKSKRETLRKMSSSNEPLNANPVIHQVPTITRRARSSSIEIDAADDSDADSDSPDYELIDAEEIYNLLATINDPEHPLTLAQLAVVNLQDIHITASPTGIETIHVALTPTIPHCSMATLIGLCVRVRLNRSLPPRFRVDVKVKEGTHQSETAVNRQLADKERVAAACENDQLMSVLSGMMESCV